MFLYGSFLTTLKKCFANKRELNIFVTLNDWCAGEKESNVLRKVASLTYDMAIEQKQITNNMRSPRSSSDKQDLRHLDTFEGKFRFKFIIWFKKFTHTSSQFKYLKFLIHCFHNSGHFLISTMLSSIDEDHYLRLLINNNDLKLLLGHFVNFFLNIGIIRPLEEGNNSEIFMVSVIYSFYFIYLFV